MKPIVQTLYPHIEKIATSNNSVLSELLYVQEYGMKILRVIVDSDETIDVDLVTIINEQISEKLDELDLIEEEYFLEVSSAGLEKELKTTEDLIKSRGKYIFLTTYEKIIVGKLGMKEFYGDLLDVEDDEIILNAKIKQFIKEVRIPRALIAKIRLAIRF